MTDISMGLCELLGRVSEDVFMREFWEKRPLLVQREARDFYTDLFSLVEFDKLLSYSDIAYPEIRGVKKDKTNLSHAFLRNSLLSGSSVVTQIKTAYKLYSEGCTLLIHGLQKRSMAVRNLCRSLESVLHHPVGQMRM